MNKQIKMVAFDLDGTLLNSEKNISVVMGGKQLQPNSLLMVGL